MRPLNRCVAATAALLAIAASAFAQSKVGTRVMCYNIEWFSEAANAERVTRLKTIVGQINPEIVAVQEVQSKAAVAQVFGNEWEIAMTDDPAEFQEVGLVVKKPYKVESVEMVFEDKSLDAAFPGKRDVLRVVVSSPFGGKAAFYVVHQKSRSGGRLATDPQREHAARLMAAYLISQRDERHIVLGDFNDCPDDVSVNILETGDLRAKPGRFTASNPLLVNLSEPLYDADVVTHGLADLFKGGPLPSPSVPGAKEENERWRGKDYDFRRDSKIHQTLLDQVLISPSLANPKPTLKIHLSRECFEGTRGRTSRNDQGVATYTEKGSRASDHVPMYVDLNL